MVINFFFGAIIGGSIFSNLEGLLSDVNGIPTVLGEQIPTVSSVNSACARTEMGCDELSCEGTRVCIATILTSIAFCLRFFLFFPPFLSPATTS
jgi:hypothetical protein